MQLFNIFFTESDSPYGEDPLTYTLLIKSDKKTAQGLADFIHNYKGQFDVNCQYYAEDIEEMLEEEEIDQTEYDFLMAKADDYFEIGWHERIDMLIDWYKEYFKVDFEKIGFEEIETTCN